MDKNASSTYKTNQNGKGKPFRKEDSMKKRTIGWTLLICLMLLAVSVIGCAGNKGGDAKQEEQIVPAPAPTQNQENGTQDIQEDEILMPDENGGDNKLPTLPTQTPAKETEQPGETTVTPAPDKTDNPAATGNPLEIDPDATATPGNQTTAPQNTATPKPGQTETPAQPTATPAATATPKPTDDGPIVLPELP